MTKIVPAFGEAFKVFRNVSSLHDCKLREVCSVTFSHGGGGGREMDSTKEEPVEDTDLSSSWWGQVCVCLVGHTVSW